MSEILGEDYLSRWERALEGEPLSQVAPICVGEIHKFIASHRQLQAERDGLLEWKKIILGTGTDQEAMIRMAATEYTQTAIESWKLANEKLTKERDALKAELEFHKQAALNFIDLSAELQKQRDALQAELAEAKWAHGDFDKAPCFICGYGGAGYYQPSMHPCAEEYHRRKDAQP